MKRGIAAAAVLFALAARAQAPIGEIWPHKLKLNRGGEVEYTYDLKALKKTGGNIDAVGQHGEEKVQTFLKNLPDSMTVKLKPGTTLALSSGGALEEGVLAPSFGAVSPLKWVSDDPLGLAQAGKLMPAMHPDEPKVLLSGDAVLWKVRQLEDGAAAALELELDRARKQFFQTIFDKAVQRAQRSQGDVREGAWALAARLAPALACMDKAKVPAAANSGDLKALVKAEFEKVALPPEVVVPPHVHDWTPELVCSHVRSWVLKHPFEGTRGGAAAPLTMIAIVDGDPKLKAQWELLRTRRDAFFGKPKEEPLEVWRAKTEGDANASIEDLGGFLASLGPSIPEPPGLWTVGQSPVRRFFDGMEGAERGNAVEELFAAAQDGRLGKPASADASWAEFRDSAWGALAAGDVGSKERQIDAEWRDRLETLFFALNGSSREAKGGERERPEIPPRTELKVVLKVPPHLDVEPLPLAYTRAAESLERLVALLNQHKLTSIRPLAPGGQAAGGAVISEAPKLATVLRGLAWLSTAKGSDEPKEATEARKFVEAWRKDGTLTRDVREVFAGPLTTGDTRPHAAVAGIGRRPLAVRYLNPPQVEVVDKVEGVIADAKAEQVYLVPVLVTVGAQAPAGALPLDAGKWRTRVDKAGKKRVGADAAFNEAVAGN
jgi:hypothetical protein